MQSNAYPIPYKMTELAIYWCILFKNGNNSVADLLKMKNCLIKRTIFRLSFTWLR
jgi:hypothetical protein